MIARIRVNHWTNQVLSILESNNFNVWLAKSYIDDFRFIIPNIPRGLKYTPEVKKFIYDPSYEEEHKALSNIEYTSLVLRELVNSICYDLTFTTENQKEYDDEFLPTLDFKVKLESDKCLSIHCLVV